jgi:hypothetical protein
VPQLPVAAGESVGAIDAVRPAEAVATVDGDELPTIEGDVDGLAVSEKEAAELSEPVAEGAELAESETLPEPLRLPLPVPVELSVAPLKVGWLDGVSTWLRVGVPGGLKVPVELTRGDTELVMEPVLLLETETDFVPLTDTVPVFVPATLRVELLLTVLLAEAERQALAEPVAELAPEPVTETEGEIVGSIVCVEDGAAEAELLSDAWAEKDATEAVGVRVPLRLPVRDTDGVRVCVQVR